MSCSGSMHTRAIGSLIHRMHICVLLFQLSMHAAPSIKRGEEEEVEEVEEEEEEEVKEKTAEL